jgi:hypothetical protein
MLRIFFALKYPNASAGFERTNWGTRGQHANHQTTEAAEDEQIMLETYRGLQFLTLCRLMSYIYVVPHR